MIRWLREHPWIWVVVGFSAMLCAWTVLFYLVNTYGPTPMLPGETLPVPQTSVHPK